MRHLKFVYCLKLFDEYWEDKNPKIGDLDFQKHKGFLGLSQSYYEKICNHLEKKTVLSEKDLINLKKTIIEKYKPKSIGGKKIIKYISFESNVKN